MKKNAILFTGIFHLLFVSLYSNAVKEDMTYVDNSIITFIKLAFSICPTVREYEPRFAMGPETPKEEIIKNYLKDGKSHLVLSELQTSGAKVITALMTSYKKNELLDFVAGSEKLMAKEIEDLRGQPDKDEYKSFFEDGKISDKQNVELDSLASTHKKACEYLTNTLIPSIADTAYRPVRCIDCQQCVRCDELADASVDKKDTE